MSALSWQRMAARDITSDVDSVKTTYSSWDTCMQKNYCKWPAIVGIILASLILLSLLSCLFRCLCCGAECCCGCLSCCNACCPSPRRRSRKDGYQQQPSPYPPPPQAYPQYHTQPPPMYVSGGASGYRTATFDAPSSSSSNRARAGGLPYNEDALPAMPGWENAQTRYVAHDDEVEMEKLPSAQQQSLLSSQPFHHVDTRYGGAPYQSQPGETTGDLGSMHAHPYRDQAFSQHQSHVPSHVESSRSTAYAPTYHSNEYHSEPQQSQPWDQQHGYAASIPPSYHTAPMSPVSPMGRRPVQGSWRDV